MALKSTIDLVNDIEMALKGANLKYPIDLPRIAVIGAQSTGKSSVLESIVGEDFLPRGRGTVTTCPLILRLVKSENDEKTAKFDDEEETFKDFDEVHKVIVEKMKRASGGSKKIVDSPINLKIEGKDIPDLTLIDLPGFTWIDTDDLSENTKEDIQELVKKYISQENTIILAISPANDDIANSPALEYAKTVDPDREKTIGVLTKADLIDKGADMKKFFSNCKYPLKHGYVFVKCRSEQDNKDKKSISQTIKEESKYFEAEKIFKDINEQQGIPALWAKLNRILTDEIISLLPVIEEKIAQNRFIEESELSKFGEESNLHDGSSRRKFVRKSARDYLKKFSEMIKHGKKNANKHFGGTKIKDIINDFKDIKLPQINPLKDLNDKCILEQIKFHYGVYTQQFVSEDVCREIIQTNLDVYTTPINDCIKEVFQVIEKWVKESVDECIKNYRNFTEMMIQTMLSIVKIEYKQLQKELTLKIAFEKSYINWEDDDFLWLNPYIMSDNDQNCKVLETMKWLYGIQPQYFRRPFIKSPSQSIHDLKKKNGEQVIDMSPYDASDSFKPIIISDEGHKNFHITKVEEDSDSKNLRMI